MLIRAQKRRRKRQGWERRRAIRQRLIEREGFCFYCGRPLGDELDGLASLDHLVPKSAGGQDDEENLVLACVYCNMRKGSVPIEFIASQRKRSGGLFDPIQLLKGR